MNPITTIRTSEPVLSNGTFATLGGALVPVLVYLGVQTDSAGRIGSFIGVGLAAIFAIWHLWSARSKVTPVEGNAIAQWIAEARQLQAALDKAGVHVALTPAVEAATGVSALEAGPEVTPEKVLGGVVEDPNV